jgi:signal transduction histidine kinase
VRDTGIGLAPEALSGLFNLFSQVHASDERSGGGLGIGLALVKSLIELHGGSISARSDGPGHGSEFVVRLPI